MTNETLHTFFNRLKIVVFYYTLHNRSQNSKQKNVILKPIQLIFNEWNYATNTHKNSETILKIKVKEN